MPVKSLLDLLSIVWVLLGSVRDFTKAVPSTGQSDCLSHLPTTRSISLYLLPPFTHHASGITGHWPLITSQVPATLNCSDASELVMVKVRFFNKRRIAKVGVFACPTVNTVQLQAEGDVQVHFLHLPSKVTVKSCNHANDTAVLTKGHKRSHVVLRCSVGLHDSTPNLRLNYAYTVHEKGRSEKNRQAEVRAARFDDHHSIQHGFRWKRSLREQEMTVSPTAYKHDNTTKEAKPLFVSTEPCGNSTSCIRYGTEGCVHLTCDYMLSYTVFNNDIVDMEISGRGNGWVAVGFSSDKFMGGDDDVIGCKLDRKLSAEVVAMSLGNSVKHTQPQEKKNRLDLVFGMVQDNHIYCRVRRHLKYKERLADSDLDLSNDWHQLYAFGDVDSTGRIMQHTELPRVSEYKISMIRPTNIMVHSSATSLPSTTSWLLFLALPLALIFAGS